jgi:hypothetical protein
MGSEMMLNSWYLSHHNYHITHLMGTSIEEDVSCQVGGHQKYTLYLLARLKNALASRIDVCFIQILLYLPLISDSLPLTNGQ